ncbi:MAG: hypothetical protein NTY87_12395 [Planctomycetia bacterium]|nr:hypothetical protein [Planctomycetia bacterium]
MNLSNNPLSLDDPRLSEWIDGRLSVSEAMDVEQAVAASTELSRAVANLRAIKKALRQIQPQLPSVGFVDRVMQAIQSLIRQQQANAKSADDETADSAVAAEWQRIETERIDEERSEALEDARAEEDGAIEAGSLQQPAVTQSQKRWQFAAMAGALAAGLLVTLVINMPRGDHVLKATTAQQKRSQQLERSRAAEQLLATAATKSDGEFGKAAANAPPEGLLVRVRVRDEEGRQRLDELLAASAFRIDSLDQEPQRLSGVGTPEVIDTLLVALAEPSSGLFLESIRVFALSEVAADKALDKPSGLAASPPLLRAAREGATLKNHAPKIDSLVETAKDGSPQRDVPTNGVAAARTTQASSGVPDSSGVPALPGKPGIEAKQTRTESLLDPPDSFEQSGRKSAPIQLSVRLRIDIIDETEGNTVPGESAQKDPQ